MSEIKSESISSLVDNYSPSIDDNISAHLVDNLIKDKELSKAWQNYHLIGDVLREEVPEFLALDLSDAIAEAISQEATVLSPNTSMHTISSDETANTNEAETTQVNTIVDATTRFKARMTTFVKPLGQVAIAASAAALMIVGVQTNVADQQLVTPSQVVQTVPFSGYANPVSFTVQSPQIEQNVQNKLQAQQAITAQKVAQQRRLLELLKDHNQQVKLGGTIK